MEGKNAKQKAEYITHLKGIVLQHLDHEDFNVSSLAAYAGVSRSELYRRIKSQTDKSVTEFIRDIRLEQGLKLLEETDMTAAEISYKVGFNSPAYFNKCFKDKFGITPGEADAGKEPVYSSLYEESVDESELTGSGFWSRRNLMVIFILVFLGGFGYWYYMVSQNRDNTNVEAKRSYLQNVTPIAGESSIAVLPLKNLTGKAENEHICLGITDAIISELRRTGVFKKVKPLTDVYQFKDSLTDGPELMEQLEVKNILLGHLQKAGNQIKISLNFIQNPEYETVWSDSFIMEWSEKETFRIQQKIVDEVLNALGDKVPDKRSKTDTLFRGTLSPKAYDLVIKGRYQTYKFTREEWENSIKLYEEAIKEDPEYVFAYHSLGYAWLWSGAVWSFMPQDTAWHNAEKYFSKILELDENNEGAIRGLKIGYFMYELNMDPRIDRFPKVETYKLENTHFDYALKMGLYAKSETSLENVIKENPSASYPHALLALTYYLSGKKFEAKKLLDDSYPLFDDDAQYLREAARTYFYLGEKNKMEVATDAFYNKFEDRSPLIHWLRAMAYDYKNEIYNRDLMLDSLRLHYNRGSSGSPAWFTALYHTYKENYESALEWLEKSYQAREVEMTWLAQEPVLAPLGREPRYQALLDSMKFPNSARAHVPLDK